MWRAAAGRPAREGDALSPAYRARLESYGAAQGLPPGTATAIHDLSSSSRHEAARRILWRMLSSGARDGYLLSAAEDLDRLLIARGCGSQVYAFGHTHVPRVAALSSGAVYVNAGSWSLPGPDSTGWPFALVTPHSRRPDVRLLTWPSSSGRARHLGAPAQR